MLSLLLPQLTLNLLPKEDGFQVLIDGPASASVLGQWVCISTGLRVVYIVYVCRYVLHAWCMSVVYAIVSIDVYVNGYARTRLALVLFFLCSTFIY